MRIIYILPFIISLLMTSCSVSPKNASVSNKNYYRGGGRIYEKEPKPTPTTSSKSNSTVSYINMYRAIAIREMELYGVPASITLAQGILESGSGNSDLALKANNHFGIKCGGEWKGKGYHKNDDRPNECFRVYRHAEESFSDHSQFLKKPRYAELFKLDSRDYKGWAHGLKKCGYATNPKYAHLLIDLIEKYELHQYDKKGGKSNNNSKGSLYFEQPQEEKKPAESKQQTQTQSQPQQTAQPKQAAPAPAKGSSKYYTVEQGDTLYSIARKHNVRVDDIMAWNNLDSFTIGIGQNLKVSE